MAKCNICGEHTDSGGIVCPKFKEGCVCYKCHTKCKFFKEAGVSIETCHYINRLRRWKRINFNFWASKDTEKFLNESLKVEEMSDTGLKERYKLVYERYKSKDVYNEARQSLGGMLYVMAKEIEKRELF